MAYFDAKTFNPEAFGKYIAAVPNVRLNKLRESRAVASDSRLKDTFVNNTQTGSVYAILPYFGLIGGEPQNYDGVENLTAERTDTFEQGVFTYGRMKAWVEADFSYDVTGGADFMANVRSQLIQYWYGADQNTILAILEGIFKMSNTGTGDVKAANKNFVDKHTYDISQSGTDVKTDESMLVGATSLNTAIQQACGDNKQRFSLVICHSTVATNLENLNLLSYLKYTDEQGIQRDLQMGTWNGRLVLVDDTMPVEVKNIGATAGKVSLYTTYVLGEGAIGFEPVGAKTPYEVYRDPNKRGGEDELITRVRNAVSVAGISYLKASQATNSPTDAELKLGANWSLVHNDTKTVSHKTVPLARIISRG